MDSPCTLCVTSPRASHESYRKGYAALHEPCSTCTDPPVQQSNLCNNCEHLRLNHLVTCLSRDDRWECSWLLPKIVGDQTARTSCTLCQLVQHTISVGHGQSALPNEDEDIGFTLIFAPVAGIYATGKDQFWADSRLLGKFYIDDPEQPAVPVLRDFVSWDTLKASIQECSQTHADCQPSNSHDLPLSFRVIDVTKRCIVQQHVPAFLALSYVWGAGSNPPLLANTSDITEDLMEEGSLSDSRMPRTIEDAMSACVQLGYRYLWADRLCIIQDDDEDKKMQVAAMGNIFSAAQTVLVAAYGDSMNSGLPGIGFSRKGNQRSEDIMSLRVTNLLDPDDPGAPWHTRCWTYQEAILCNRRIYLSNGSATFECRQSWVKENQVQGAMERQARFSDRLFIPEEDECRYGAFARHLYRYSERSLTYRADAYHSIYGVLRALYPEDNALIYGIPRNAFDYAILWFVIEEDAPMDRFELGDVILPSWSWISQAGLSKAIAPLDLEGHEEFYGSLVSWYLSDDFCSGKLETLNTFPELLPEGDWQLYMAIACQEHCIDDVSLPFDLTTNTFAGLREMSTARWRDYGTFCKEVLSQTLDTSGMQKIAGSHTLRHGVLITKCQTAMLKLAAIPIGGQETLVGIVSPDNDAVIGGLICSSDAELASFISSDQNGLLEYEFIGLSLWKDIRRGSSGPHPEPTGRPRNFREFVDVEGNRLPSPIVHVMMVERKGVYVQRRKLGYVWLTEWARLRRVRKKVLLE